MGRNCINGRQTIGLVWIFSFPPPLRNVPGSPADVVIPGGASRTRKDKGQRQSGCTGGWGGAGAVV